MIDSGAKFLPEEIAEFKQIATRELITAASKGDFLVVESCVREGADVNAKDAKGDSALCLFLNSVDMDRYNSREYGTQILSELIKAGADVNATSADGHSPLYLAQQKNKEWCKILIDSGAKLLPAEATEILAKIVNGKSTYIDVDAPTLIQWGAEPVSAAEATQCLVNTVKNGKIRNGLSIELLLQWGADVNAMIGDRRSKKSLLYYAYYDERLDPDVLSYDIHNYKRANPEIVAALKRAGAKMTPEEIQEVKNLFVRALVAKNLSVIRHCINSGIDLNTPVEESGGMSWLAFARTIDSACADILEKAGAKMTPEEIEAERSPDGLAAMIGAGNAEGLRRLFAEGVDPNLKVKDDESGEESSLLATAIVWHNMKINPNAQWVFECLPEKEEERNAVSALLSTTTAGKTQAVIKVIKDAGGKITAEEKKELSLWKLDEMLRLGRLRDWNEIAKTVEKGEIDLSAESDGVNGFHLLADSIDSTEKGLTKAYLDLYEETNGTAETTANASIDESFINALLKAGADINGKTKTYKRSPLAVAIYKSNPEAVALFLRNGADPNDTIPVKGRFGDAGEKSLMDLAIEISNNKKDAYRKNRDGEAREMMRRAEEVMNRMAQATGTKLVDL